jgi:hypothetical protein
LDWQENQGPGWAGYDVRKQPEPVVRSSARDVVPARQSVVLPKARGPGLVPGRKRDTACSTAGSNVLDSR